MRSDQVTACRPLALSPSRSTSISTRFFVRTQHCATKGLIDLRRGRGAVIRAEFDSGRTALNESAREFVRQARNLGLDTAHMLDLIKETSTQ
ncbi:GntR family transcriptional regulator [Rhodococcus erythropolis]|uniref:GntR family transcriptional regulator n=1 Tax=Rhodococcus erythropolis TaxID=1833 RepID=A0A6G9CTG3_RHOER|nr:GntR family transcriptional regulator [Rhodococcus erythropolis]